MGVSTNDPMSFIAYARIKGVFIYLFLIFLFFFSQYQICRNRIHATFTLLKKPHVWEIIHICSGCSNVINRNKLNSTMLFQNEKTAFWYCLLTTKLCVEMFTPDG